MIDLAGSEKASAQESRRKEGAYINKSLLTLGTVISRLSSPGATRTSPTPLSTPSTPQANHIPYRDSKLTRLLQPSLSGGGYITILATICGGQKFSAETLSTLQFAKRAKKIPAKAVQAESFVEHGFEGEMELRRLVADYQIQIEDLKRQLEHEQTRKIADEQTRKIANNEMNELKIQRENLNNRIERLSVLALAAGDGRNPIVQQVTLLPVEILTGDYHGVGVGIIHTLRIL
jgi:centromeric protein E